MNRDFRRILVALALAAFPLTAGASALPPAPRPSVQAPVVPAPNLADKLDATIGNQPLLATIPPWDPYTQTTQPYTQGPFDRVVPYTQTFNNSHAATTPAPRGMTPSQAFRAIRRA